MSNFRIACISTTLFLSPLMSHAQNVDEELKLCASTALETFMSSNTKITLANPKLKSDDLDHDFSRHRSEFRMLVSNPTSGESLGTVTCAFSSSGELISSVFDSSSILAIN